MKTKQRLKYETSKDHFKILESTLLRLPGRLLPSFTQGKIFSLYKRIYHVKDLLKYAT